MSVELADKVRVTLIEALPNVLPMFSKVASHLPANTAFGLLIVQMFFPLISAIDCIHRIDIQGEQDQHPHANNGKGN
jgi:hypothetical protein